MLLNEMIMNSMNEEPRNVERFDEMGMNMLHDMLASEPLTLLEFTTLADMYDVNYKFTLESKIQTLVFDNNSKMMIWNALDELYHQLTCRRLYSANLTLNEVMNKFNEIYVKLSVQ